MDPTNVPFQDHQQGGIGPLVQEAGKYQEGCRTLFRGFEKKIQGLEGANAISRGQIHGEYILYMLCFSQHVTLPRQTIP